MKLLKSLLMLSLFVVGFSCELQEESPVNKEEYSFFITGIKESVTYTFSSGNERVASTPDEVKSLTILIMDEFGDLVYESRFNEWSERGVIPDSIFIPALPEGDYNIYAVTVDYYNYWYYDGNSPEDSVNYGGNTTKPYGNLILEPYTVNEGPIYVGSKSISLTEDEQHIVIDMSNISAKVTLSSSDSIRGWLEVNIQTTAPSYYDFDSDSFVEEDYENYIYGYLDNYASERSFYILPQTLVQLNINFYHYNNYSVSPKIALDPPIEMNVGDAITFNIDIEALLAGSGTGTFVWEDITWNDLGEISIP